MSTLALNSETPAPSGSAIDGGMQLWAGLSFGSASLVNYLALSGIIHFASPAMIGLVWMAAAGAFILFGLILKVGADRSRAMDPAYRRFRSLWGSLILGAMFLVGSLIIVLGRFDMAQQASFIVSPIALCIYGIGWRIAAVMSGRKWPNLLCVGCFLCAPYLATLAGTPQQSLVYSLCLVVFAILPGLFLQLRRSV